MHGSVLSRGDVAFDEVRHRCIQQWDLLLRSRGPSVAIAAIHSFNRPGLDGFWQRHGIATASAALEGGLALGAAHFRDSLPQPSHSTLASSPPENISGMVSLDLDPQGRLIRFLGVPRQTDDRTAAQPMDWKKLFDAAGLDPSRWSEAASQEIPPNFVGVWQVKSTCKNWG
jgi:hypothetical protein